MGFLEVGAPPLSWNECKRLSAYIKAHGITQFLNLYNLNKDHRNHILYWGDEMEYHMVYLDPTARKPKIYLEATDVLRDLCAAEEAVGGGSQDWHPEYGAWMVESTPNEPYGENTRDLLIVEAALAIRRRKLAVFLQMVDPNLAAVSLPVFPLLGVGSDYMYPQVPLPMLNEASQSLYLDDRVINPHPRFPTLTKHIVQRRERPVNITIPIYQDTATTAADEPYPGKIHMDACGFGMGNCCLQLTLNTCCLLEARFLYDQLTPLTPILLALSATAPIFKGKLAAIDCRWTVISQAMDDRTEEETATGSIPKSRYSGVACYISTGSLNKPAYTPDIPYDLTTFNTLIAAGVDETLARHLGYLFLRDPLVIYSDKVEVDDSTTTIHFENIQSTNWQSMRFKPPPSINSKIGWRIEFRPMDIQITDVENAALVIFMVLLARATIAFKLNFQTPLPMVDTNMDRAHAVDAVLTQRFHWKLNVVRQEMKERHAFTAPAAEGEDVIEELTAAEIFFGKGTYDGLFKYVDVYLKEAIACPADQYSQLNTRYFELLRRRLKGEIPTGARFLRNFVLNHPQYQHDSIVSGEIAFDLVKLCTQTSWNEQLLGPSFTHASSASR